MALHVVKQEALVGSDNDVVVLAHGFSQNAGCWGGIRRELAQTHTLKLVDMPGHGRSGYDQADMFVSGDLLGQAGGKASYVGYSMGGRIALHTALQHPSIVEKLILIGVNPGLETDKEISRRQKSDLELAANLRSDGLDTFLRQWISNPLFSGITDDTACLEQRLENRVDGLAATLEHRSVGRQDSLWSRLHELAVPVLLIAGEDDAKYRALNSRAAKILPDAKTCVIPGGHAVHLQRPQLVAAAIQSFL